MNLEIENKKVLVTGSTAGINAIASRHRRDRGLQMTTLGRVDKAIAGLQRNPMTPNNMELLPTSARPKAAPKSLGSCPRWTSWLTMSASPKPFEKISDSNGEILRRQCPSVRLS
jgi:hypothetical protein